MKSLRLLCVALVAAAFAALAIVPAAIAAPGEPFVLAETFDGSATPDGSMETTGVAVNREAGRVLVVDSAHSAVLQFDESGDPVNFAATGTPKLKIPAAGQIAVDNSGGPSQGDFYILHPSANVEGFTPGGAKLAGWPVTANNAMGSLIAIGVDPSGHPWFSYFNEENSLMEQHDVTGAATGLQIKTTRPGQQGEQRMNAITFAFDSHENLYYGDGAPYLPQADFVYRRNVAENYVPRHLINDGKTKLIAIDPSTDDLFVSHTTSITADRYADEPETVPPFETLPGLNVTGMDFSGDGQTLFVAEGPKVSVFKRQPPRIPVIAEPPSFVGVKSRDSFASSVADTGGGAPATFAFEFASEAEWAEHPGVYGHTFPTPGYTMPHTTFGPQAFSNLVDGLEPLTTYHVRAAVTNVTGTGYSPDAILRTLPPGDSGGIENCENALARKQTGASALPDCRAYELVSAPYAGGFDVESPMVPGQQPFAGYPSADGRVLYGVHAGIIPGPWNPTNNGIDPYVAVRGAAGWTTEYVGLPAELSPSKSRFSSVLGGADADLRSFAFAGPGLCDPCFESSPETGIPLRQPNGELIQAMVGDNSPEAPNIKPEGRVAKMLSDDGHHLIFGSQSPLVDGANSSGGNLNIFDRDLVAKHTQLVSTTPVGTAIQAGMDVSEIDLSSDGSRVLIGTKVSADAAGNEFAHLYLHIGGSPNTVDLTPTFNQGVIFAGMTRDGSKVFFTSRENLLPADGDSAADLYEAEVGPTGDLELKLLTPATGGGACNPASNSAGAHWNTVDATADCSVVAIGGGAGVASANGTTFVLSPEQLDGSNGVADQPNLFEIGPDGSPEFVATLSPNDPLVLESMHDAATPASADLQTTPDGGFAAFRSTLPLTEVKNSGKASVYLFQRGTPKPVCVSCNPTLTEDPTQQGEATLGGQGLAITDDGRLFFNTSASLSVEDTGGSKDIYEWTGGRPRLISSGIGRFDSELLTVTHDGTDAFFYTHDTLDAKIDENGERTKIYDARVKGGLFALPQAPGCRASDECHGPGTIAPGPPQIGSSGPTSDGNLAKKGCPKGKVKKHGKCVKKPKHKKSKKSKKNKKGKKDHG